MSLLAQQNQPLAGLYAAPRPNPPGFSSMSCQDLALWCFNTGCDALNNGYWSLAKGCFHSTLSHFADDHHHHGVALYNLALCLVATGHSDIGQSLLEEALAFNPDHEQALASLGALVSEQDRWENLPWFQPGLARDAELCLEPVEVRHLPVILEQFSDPAMAAQVNSQAITTMDEGRDWLAEQQADNRATYAVIHHDLGLVGCTGLTMNDDTAWFWFWIGRQWQGCHFGSRAARLAALQMQAMGKEAIYTAVFPDNEPSIKALTKAGFEKMSLLYNQTDDPALFYGCGLVESWLPEAGEEALQELLRMIAPS